MVFINYTIVLFTLFGLFQIPANNAVFFLVNSEKKCFTAEQPRDTPMVFNFNLIDDDHTIGFDLYYGSQPVKELHIMHQIIDDSRVDVEYTTDNDGFYCYCVQQILSKDSNEPSRLSLRLSYGFDDDHYDKLMKDHNFDAVNLQVHKLNDLLTMTLNEADYQKHKEVEYHEETEKMNSAALWWPIVQIGILIITGIFQVQHLKSFFKSNKLI